MEDFAMLIDGKLTPGHGSIDVLNPATAQAFAKAPHASPAQLDLAVAAARRAFPGWRDTPVEDRRRVLLAMADVIEANAEELGRYLTMEQGKPLADAIGEARATAGAFRAFAAFDLPVKVIEDSQSRRVEAHRRPLGVVAAIVPWNFPLSLLAFKMPPALLAGNTMVIKPAATTPLSTLRIGALIADIAPPGVVNIISDDNDLGHLLSAHPDVRKVSFTGSTETGRKVMAGAAATLKRLTLELGGNDAAIVLDDVNPREVAGEIFRAAFRNSGQICIAIKRVYAHESIHDELCDEIARLANEAVVGDGLAEGVRFGPLQNKAQYHRVAGLIEDARTKGTIIAGGEPPEGPGYFIRPTVVKDVSNGVRVVDEEQFGPVLPIIKFSDIDDAIAMANDSPWGLGGSVWSGDWQRAADLAGRFESGTVWINQHGHLSPMIPFGGSKQSGFGVEMAEAGLEEFTQLQVISVLR
ncbi:aldehyde dehydrogenase [Sphingomonas panacis]|uniref:Aldehyde dehydrogenase n=1 Tax=Sphingomonas panacis TaxID=1560345 RepID=A0A1B3Z785_9SPHN|nr:aldehyde dehydrogenase family protein [Sphingomonas panacis]AOH83285.1 aldehyde dehydrogenase [Sphingomonas panacis]